MPHRIDIELTSARDDGSWTWRASGARQPRGVVDGSILPDTPAVGDQLKVEADYGVDGISILSIVSAPKREERDDVLELLPADANFEPVIEQRVKRDRPDRSRGRPGPRRERGDRSDRGSKGDRTDRDGGDRRGDPTAASAGGGDGRDQPGEGGRKSRRQPHRHFAPPPELPKRPKPKRLRPGSQRRTEVLDQLPEASRPIAELALQGIPAVRQRLRQDNAKAKKEGRPEMPEDSVISMAEELLPKLRAAEWLDRAEAAKRQLEHLDLRDLRSVVASSDDPVVVREESTRTLAAELKAALIIKQDQELHLWFEDIAAALDVGRVIRALRLSSEPPKAGVPFPGELATRLSDATNASLQPGDGPDRWSAVLEAAAFSPIRLHVQPAAIASNVSEELKVTVTRLGPLLPQVASQFGIEVSPKAPSPRPLRPTRPTRPTKDPARSPKRKIETPDEASAGPAPAVGSQTAGTESVSRGTDEASAEIAESPEVADGSDADPAPST
ncbi:MAG: hypothetical protein M3337_03530 [Actinomycetota bacterium]|nr:hypothetical protein [Actinomycetota bacterium]